MSSFVSMKSHSPPCTLSCGLQAENADSPVIEREEPPLHAEIMMSNSIMSSLILDESGGVIVGQQV